MRTRTWSIRSKIIALVSVPLAALLALWLFATTLTAGPAFNLLSAQTLLDSVGNPGHVLVGELQRERRLSVEFLSVAGEVPPALTAQRAATDRAAGQFRTKAGSAKAHDAAGDTLRLRIQQVFTEIDSLAGNRQHIDRREIDAVGAQGAYNSAIAAAFQMFATSAILNDELVDREGRGLTTIGQGQEYLSRVDSLLAGANDDGDFSDGARTEMLQDIGTANFLLQAGADDMPAETRTAYEKVSSGTAFTRLRDLQNTLLVGSRTGKTPPLRASDWQPVYDSAAQQLHAFETQATSAAAVRATPVATGILVRLAVAGLVGLLALIISIVVSAIVGRSIVGRLGRLRGEALELATVRLPTVVQRLQRGETVDVEVETPALAYGNDEIGQLGNAFNDVRRTAVQSAVDEANVRRGINEVFLNIARRSQTLLHRQLALLDQMERRETQPQELEDLYRIDHLATRMRRHAEDLVILAGATPGRGWRNPVPVIDVVRGAISEVEDYQRVDIRSVESSAVLGRAVADVIHLLAELLENAASFSPPHTRVTVTGQVLPNGYVIEIDDRGLGMTPEALQVANHRLLEPPEFDPTDSARLGLFVVAQLAYRHQIRVSLRPSAYGGVTAVVLVPGELVAVGVGSVALPVGPTADKSWDRPNRSTTGDLAGRLSIVAQRSGADPLPQLTAATPAPANNLPALVGEGNSSDLRARRSVPRNSAPTDLVAPAMPEDVPRLPRPATEDGLPRRTRQASLAPQLRRTAASEEQIDTQRLRPPEQARGIMSALQRGTTRGRIDASQFRPPPDSAASEPESSASGPGSVADGESRSTASADVPASGSFAEAATVSFPAIVDLAFARDWSVPGLDLTGTEAKVHDPATADVVEQDTVTRPERDA